MGEDLQVIERDLARSALADEVKRLMTIPGVDMTVALAMKAAIGDASLGNGKTAELSQLSFDIRWNGDAVDSAPKDRTALLPGNSAFRRRSSSSIPP